MKVRPYKSSDFEPVVNLFTASVHGLAKGYYDSAQRVAWAPQPPAWADWHERLSRLQTFVAEDSCEVVGFISYELNGYIDLLYVSPHHSRYGVALELYRAAESALILAGAEQLHTEASLVARAFFESQGFFIQGRQTVNRRGVVLRRYAMRKPIRATQ